MKQMLTESRDHLEGVGETYGEHMHFALGVSRLLLVAGFCCAVHAMVPALFPTSASRRIRLLHAILDDRTRLHAAGADTAPLGPFMWLVLLSVMAAAVPWLGQAAAVVAVPLSLLALSFPVAYLIGERQDSVRPAAI
jgi:hypothetical protein